MCGVYCDQLHLSCRSLRLSVCVCVPVRLLLCRSSVPRFLVAVSQFGGVASYFQPLRVVGSSGQSYAASPLGCAKYDYDYDYD